MLIASIVGARPQFIKAAPISAALQNEGHEECLIHTGQHYDYTMSGVFFEQMNLPKPHVNLGIGSVSPGEQVGLMLIGLEKILRQHRPNCVLVHGDTNSTLAGALAACKLDLPLAHVEAGLRSFNRTMPEEHNRVLTDHCSNFLFCPTATAVKNLEAENVVENVYLTGDVTVDAIKMSERYVNPQRLADFGLRSREYVLVTIHRPYNTDNDDAFGRILAALSGLSLPVVFPVHPRTRKKINSGVANVRLIEPVNYFDMLLLEKSANVIVTDSGGVQKEAYILGVPCVTTRTETEWVETLVDGWNVLVGSSTDNILQAVRERIGWRGCERGNVFGSGIAAEKIVQILDQSLKC